MVEYTEKEHYEFYNEDGSCKYKDYNEYFSALYPWVYPLQITLAVLSLLIGITTLLLKIL